MQGHLIYHIFLHGVFNLLFLLVVTNNFYLITIKKSQNVILEQDKIYRLATIHSYTESIEAAPVRHYGIRHLKLFVIVNTQPT